MSAEPPPPAVVIRDLRFAWQRGGPPLLDIPEFVVGAGERVFLRGPSGAGKSTLLGLIAGVLSPDSGSVSVLGRAVSDLGPARRDQVRADNIGVIFQLFNLLPYLSVLANVTLPCRFSAARAARAGDVEAEARRLLKRLGFSDPALLAAKAAELSVGQQQRVAAARALIGSPGLIIADEPTSALDADSRNAFISLLIEECEASGAALLFVSHDAGLSAHFDRAEDLTRLNRAERTGRAA